MRKLLYILLTLLGLTACERDFDELRDTTQRSVTFQVDCSQLFDSLLVQTSDGYQFGYPAGLPDSMRVRLCAYCYLGDSLVASGTKLSSSLSMQQLTLRHLEKEQTYHFVLLADVVRHDPYVSFYETWFQLETTRYSTFRIFSGTKNDSPAFNQMLSAELDITVANQEVRVQLKPLMYNGYCVLTQTSGLDKVSGYVAYPDYFKLKVTALVPTKIMHDFTYYSPLSDSLTIPVVTARRNTNIVLYVITNSNNRQDTTSVSVKPSNRPFVLRFNCQDKTYAMQTY